MDPGRREPRVEPPRLLAVDRGPRCFARSQAVREQIIADFWENPLLHFAEVTDADHRAAIQLLRQHADKSYPFCDAISFVVMRRLGVKRVAAFDDHFRPVGGFEVIG